MPALITPGITGQREDITDLIFAFDPQATPALSTIPKGDKPTNLIHQWQAEKPRRITKGGLLDNTPAGQAKQYYSRALVASVPQLFRAEWAVGIIAMAISNGHVAGVSNLRAHEIEMALKAIKLGIDEVICDDNDCVNAGQNGSETRGLGSWIQSTQQTTNPVPTDYLPSASQIFSGAFANITEITLQGLLAASWQQGRVYRRFIGYVGLSLKQVISNWTIYYPNVASTTNVRQFRNDIADRVLAAVIDILKTDAGEVELHVSGNLGVPRTSTDTYTIGTAQLQRGYFIPQEDGNWELGTALPIGNQDLPDDGGGERGVVQGIVDVRANPKTMIKIAPTS